MGGKNVKNHVQYSAFSQCFILFASALANNFHFGASLQNRSNVVKHLSCCLIVPAWVGPAASSSSTPCWSELNTRRRWTSTVTWRSCVLRGTTWSRQKTSTSLFTTRSRRPSPAAPPRFRPKPVRLHPETHADRVWRERHGDGAGV